MENKQLQQAKDTIAKKYGYANFEQFDDKSTFGYNHNTPKIIDEISIEYHRLISEWVSVDERLPEIIDGKLKPILCNDGKITHKAYYFPSKSKIIEFLISLIFLSFILIAQLTFSASSNKSFSSSFKKGLFNTLKSKDETN